MIMISGSPLNESPAQPGSYMRIGGLVPYSRVPQKCSIGVLVPPPATRTPPMLCQLSALTLAVVITCVWNRSFDCHWQYRFIHINTNVLDVTAVANINLRPLTSKIMPQNTTIICRLSCLHWVKLLTQEVRLKDFNWSSCKRGWK